MPAPEYTCNTHACLQALNQKFAKEISDQPHIPVVIPILPSRFPFYFYQKKIYKKGKRKKVTDNMTTLPRGEKKIDRRPALARWSL